MNHNLDFSMNKYIEKELEDNIIFLMKVIGRKFLGHKNYQKNLSRNIQIKFIGYGFLHTKNCLKNLLRNIQIKFIG